MKQRLPVLTLILLVLVLTGCSRAAWPPPGTVIDGSRSSSSQGSVTKTVSESSSAGAVSSVKSGQVVVVKGDSVWRISKRYRVPMRALIETNRLKPPYVLHVGQRLLLPRGKTHVVKTGDTLYSISRHYNVDSYDLARTNNLKMPYLLNAGLKLNIPSRRTDQSPVQVASIETTQSAVTITEGPSIPPQKPTFSSQKAVSLPAQNIPAKKIPSPPARSGKGFIWPLKGKLISTYGAKNKGFFNDGINISARRGTTIRSIEAGVVAYSGNELRGFGNLLLIKHSGGWVSAYAHNEKLLVKRGDKIRRGQVISTVGSTGNVATPQLHFELRKGRRALDPRKYLKKQA